MLFPVASPIEPVPDNYTAFLAVLKQKIEHERRKAIMAGNTALVLLYWDIGKSILEKQGEDGEARAKVIDRLSHDLRKEFPDMHGFSPRNLDPLSQSWLGRTGQLCNGSLHKYRGAVI